ncbi:MAG: hypothetical protein CML67_18350 [Rhodobacteraceae bacterium]|nr:hypothetical protein [Paracoccaceae bacterium]
MHLARIGFVIPKGTRPLVFLPQRRNQTPGIRTRMPERRDVMSHAIDPCSSPPARSSTLVARSFLTALSSALGTLLQTAWRRRKNRRTVAGLLEMDDHILADIGVTRSDVEIALSRRDIRDPSVQLALLRNEARMPRPRVRRR